MARMRLDKMLTGLQCGSRKEVGTMIRAGRVQVDGNICRDPAEKVDADCATVCVDGKQLHYQAERYYMMHKPAGVITASDDPRHPTVMGLVPESLRRGLFAVGRLDKDTEGLLLFTTDGVWSHSLMAPRRHVEKEYEAETEGVPDADAEERFRQGLTLGDGSVCLPAELRRVAQTETGAVVCVILREGKYHQVKRMLRAVGCQVTALRRNRIGPLSLDSALAPGQMRELTAVEVELLRQATEQK